MKPPPRKPANLSRSTFAAVVSIGFAVAASALVALIVSAAGHPGSVSSAVWATALAFVGLTSITLYWALGRNGVHHAGKVNEVAQLRDLLQRADAMFELANMGLRLVERHGGQVQASAEPGKGATFRFHLGADIAPPLT